MRVLGIDPGLALMGYAVVEEKNGVLNRVTSGCIRTGKELPAPARLKMLYDEISELINIYAPAALVVEKLFFNRNTATALQVGEARGLVLLMGGQRELDVFEYTPLQVKQSMTGYGRASKDQVRKLVCLLLNYNGTFANDDEADAVAIALCHFQHRKWNKAIERGGLR